MTDAQRLVARLRTTGTIADHLLKSEAAAMIEQQAQRIGAWSELLWDIYKAVYEDKDARGMADPLAILPKVVLALRKRNIVLEKDNAESEAGIEKLTDILRRNGFVECNIAACNCGSWHLLYGLRERWEEVKELVGEAGFPLTNDNGHVLSVAVSELISDRDSWESKAKHAYGREARLTRQHDEDVHHCMDRDSIASKLSAAEAERDKLRGKIHAANASAEAAEQLATVARNMADEQALDAGLWFVAKTAPEGYLQQALRRLHAAVEGGAAIAARTEEKT